VGHRPDLDELRQRRDELLAIAARRGASNLAVFGSVARGDADEGSDVDILVDLESGRSLLDLGGLLMDLREALGCDVDVVTRTGLRPRVRERVLAEATPL
jgi:predicted nucleotidyltransferase